MNGTTKAALTLAAINAALLGIGMASCPANFNLQLLGRCLLVDLTRLVSWCEAQRFCWEAGGELLTDLEIVRLGSGGLETIGSRMNRSSGWIWLGVSDLLNERYSQRSGWQIAGSGFGGVFPSGSDYWRGDGREPNGGLGENCLAYSISMEKLNDVTCLAKMGIVCQQRPMNEGTQHRQLLWRSVAMERVLRSGAPQYCFVLTSQPSVSRCAAFAARQNLPAKAVVYSRSSKICRVLLFTDSLLIVGDTTGASDWAKLRLSP